MGNVRIIDPAQDARWDRFVTEHPLGLITHLSDWKVVLESSFRHMRGYYLVIFDTGGRIKAALPLFEIRSRLTGRRLVSIPFATLSDPLVSTREEMNELLDAAVDLSRDLGSSSIEIRSYLCKPSLIQDDRFIMQNSYKSHALSLGKRPEELLKTFHCTSIRQRIKQAAKSNLILKIGKDDADLSAFYKLYLQMRKRHGLPPLPYSFIRQLVRVFIPSGKAALLLAMKGTEAIGGSIVLKYKNRVSVEFMASNTAHRNLRPDHFLYWEAIKMAQEAGYEVLDFGRTSLSNEGLMEFKNRWGTTVTDLPQFYYMNDNSIELGNRENSLKYKFVSAMCRHAPDFAFERIGNFLYRHLG